MYIYRHNVHGGSATFFGSTHGKNKHFPLNSNKKVSVRMKLSGKQDVLSPLTLPDSSAFCSLSPSKDVSNGGAPNQLVVTLKNIFEQCSPECRKECRYNFAVVSA